MPTARNLPSGSWRCQVFSHHETVLDKDGDPVINPDTGAPKQRRVYLSFTRDDPAKSCKRRAEAMAADYVT